MAKRPIIRSSVLQSGDHHVQFYYAIRDIAFQRPISLRLMEVDSRMQFQVNAISWQSLEPVELPFGLSLDPESMERSLNVYENKGKHKI